MATTKTTRLKLANEYGITKSALSFIRVHATADMARSELADLFGVSVRAIDRIRRAKFRR